LLALVVLAFVAAGPLNAHETVSLDEMLEKFGWDFESTTIKSQEIGAGLHVLYGLGGNIAVSTGENGTLLVDDQFPQLMPKIRAKLRELGSEQVDFIINTHWHFDHADGNQVLGKEGSWIVAQENSRAMMMGDHVINLVFMRYEQKAYPPDALPVITYGDRMQFHLNSQNIDLMHFGPAHTTGDTVVYFRGHNAIHMGDVFNRGYPFVDADSGGDLTGMIHSCRQVLKVINEDTVVIPGHGEVSDHAGLVAYVEMLETVRERMLELISQGADLEAVTAAKPTAEFDEEFGDPTMLLDRAFASLVRELEAGE